MNPEQTEATAGPGAQTPDPSWAAPFLHAGSSGAARTVPVSALGRCTPLRLGVATPVQDPELAWLEEPEALTPKTREDSMSNTRIYCAICGGQIDFNEPTGRFAGGRFLAHADCIEEMEGAGYEDFLLEQEDVDA